MLRMLVTYEIQPIRKRSVTACPSGQAAYFGYHPIAAFCRSAIGEQCRPSTLHSEYPSSTLTHLKNCLNVLPGLTAASTTCDLL